MTNEINHSSIIPMTDFVRVQLEFPDLPDKNRFSQLVRHEDLVHRDDLRTFIEAKIKLHYSPGVDPKTGKRSPYLQSISVCDMLVDDRAWIAKANLGATDGEPSARTIKLGPERIVWLHPDYENAEEEAYMQMIAEENAANS